MPPEIATLGPLRMPAAFAAFGPRDLMAAAALGILLALLLAALVRPFVASRRADLRRLRAELADIARLPPQERLFRQGAILKRLGGRFDTEERRVLYGGGSIDPADIDRRILVLATRRR